VNEQAKAYLQECFLLWVLLLNFGSLLSLLVEVHSWKDPTLRVERPVGFLSR